MHQLTVNSYAAHGYVQGGPKSGHTRRVSARGVWVYPYPRVYLTRPVPTVMGRVWVGVLRVGLGMGTKSTGTGIPVFTCKEHQFSRC